MRKAGHTVTVTVAGSIAAYRAQLTAILYTTQYIVFTNNITQLREENACF